MDMNNLSIIGRITRELEMKTVGQNNTNILNFSIAVGGFKKDETSFFDVVSFGKTAELINQYLSKGSQIGITGSIKQERYQDKEGNNKSKISIIAQNVQFIGGKNESSNSSNNGSSANSNSSSGVDFPKPDSNDIPF